VSLSERFQYKLARYVLGALLLIPPVSMADPWLAPGDALMRHDLSLLADAGLLRGPITHWPVPWPDVARDVLEARLDAEREPDVQAALVRVQRAARRAMRTGEFLRSGRVAVANEPDALRGFAYTPREEGEMSAAIDWMGERLAMRLQATVVAGADDDKTLRADGSYIGVSFFNFMLSAGYMERWWGPGWDGSLIMSTSARPVPAITLERNYSDPFDFPVLKWFGPWRAGIFFGRLEGDRSDFDNAQLFGARVTFKPWRHLEIGLSRTAQWCGDGRPCDFDTFADLFLGRDNQEDLTQQPGNQLAGYDVRLSSPWRAVPVAFYGQLIGEDEAGALPAKFLGLAGVEWAGELAGGSVRATLEYSDATCNFSHSEPLFDCAYESVIYTQGYRYRGRSLGHATDSDGRMLSVGAMYVADDGTSWDIKVRNSELNRNATATEPNHTTAPLATDVQSIDLGHRRSLFGGTLTAALGLERREAVNSVERNDQWRVSAQWLGSF
jgi:hypothetical protein